MCVNFAADINREVWKFKFKIIKKNVYLQGVTMYAIVVMWLIHLCTE